MEAPWLPTVLNMLEDIQQHCPVIKDLFMDVLVGHGFKGVPYLHFTHWVLRDMCCTDRGCLLQYVRKWWGKLGCLEQRSTSNVGKNAEVGVFERMYQAMPYLLFN